nr:hypothetical protein [uncultured Cohaesibacter sp.]
MTSISGLGTSLFSTMQQMRPEDRVEQELQSLVAAGEISSDDQDALSTALDAIGNEMQGTAPGASTPPPSKEEVQNKIDSLIQDQVEAGTLTEEQADELSSLFEDVTSASSPDGASGPGGPGGPGGPPPGPPPGEASATSSEETSSDDDTSTLLQTFLEKLQEQNASGYGSAGNLTGNASLLFSFSA